MDEAQRPRVQALPAQALFRPLVAVDQIAEQRVADVRHVHADLVRAAGLQLAADVRVAVVARDDRPVRDRVAGVFGRHGHALAVRRVAADGRVDRAGIFAQIAADDGLIRAGHRMVGQLRRERKMRKVVFRRDEQTGCVLVDAVHDAGPPLPADAGEAVAAVGEQGVDERAVLVAGRGVHDHAARLIDDDEVIVLIHHVQRQILRHQLRGRGIRQRDDKRVAGRCLVVFLHGRAVFCHRALREQPLGGAARELRKRARKESVDPLGALLCLNRSLFHQRSENSAKISSSE